MNREVISNREGRESVIVEDEAQEVVDTRVWSEDEVIAKRIYTLDDRDIASVQVRILDCKGDPDLIGVCSVRLRCGMDIWNIEVRPHRTNSNRLFIQIPHSRDFRTSEDLRFIVRSRVSRCYEWLENSSQNSHAPASSAESA